MSTKSNAAKQAIQKHREVKTCVICGIKHHDSKHSISLLLDLTRSWYVSQEDRRLTREQGIVVCSARCAASFRDLYSTARLWRMHLGPTLLDELIGAGFATLAPGSIMGPVTTSGRYLTGDGWWVTVRWNGAVCDVEPMGYSADYNRALALAEERYGAWGPSNDTQVTEMIRRELGIK